MKRLLTVGAALALAITGMAVYVHGVTHDVSIILLDKAVTGIPVRKAAAGRPARSDEGGTCYGDSAGPTLATAPDSKEYVVAVFSTGDVPCWSTSVNNRTDTQEVHDFLAPYLALS
jgi:hypothetical protein